MRAEKARSRITSQKMGMQAIGVALFLVTSMGFAVPSSNLLVISFDFVVAERGIDCIETSQQAREAFLATANLCGKAFGLLDSMRDFVNIVASVIAGLPWSVWSPPVPFVYLSAWALVDSLYASMMILRDHHPRARLSSGFESYTVLLIPQLFIGSI